MPPHTEVAPLARVPCSWPSRILFLRLSSAYLIQVYATQWTEDYEEWSRSEREPGSANDATVGLGGGLSGMDGKNDISRMFSVIRNVLDQFERDSGVLTTPLAS